MYHFLKTTSVFGLALLLSTVVTATDLCKGMSENECQSVISEGVIQFLAKSTRTETSKVPLEEYEKTITTILKSYDTLPIYRKCTQDNTEDIQVFNCIQKEYTQLVLAPDDSIGGEQFIREHLPELIKSWDLDLCKRELVEIVKEAPNTCDTLMPFIKNTYGSCKLDSLKQTKRNIKNDTAEQLLYYTTHLLCDKQNALLDLVLIERNSMPNFFVFSMKQDGPAEVKVVKKEGPEDNQTIRYSDGRVVNFVHKDGKQTISEGDTSVSFKDDNKGEVKTSQIKGKYRQDTYINMQIALTNALSGKKGSGPARVEIFDNESNTLLFKTEMSGQEENSELRIYDRTGKLIAEQTSKGRKVYDKEALKEFQNVASGK